ncbi:MAG: hypothetical protein H7Y04_13145, partial [Verrucomicrobia bacterium]|nr:hypothetical protein [Cytophagales bacterium]
MRGWLFRLILGFLIVIFLLLSGGYWFIVQYEKEIKVAILEEAGQKIHGKVYFDAIEFDFFEHFPDISVVVINSSILDSALHRNVLRAERIFFHANLSELLTNNLTIRQVGIKNATIVFITDSSGYSNLQIFKDLPKKTPSNPKKNKSRLDFTLQKIVFKQVSISFIDSSQHKLISFQLRDVQVNLGRNREKVLPITLHGNVFFQDLGFNLSKGSFLKDKETVLNLKSTFDFKSKILNLDTSQLVFDKQVLNLAGKLDFSKKSAFMKLAIFTDAIEVEKAKTLLTKHINKKIEDYAITEPVALHALLQGELRPKTD